LNFYFALLTFLDDCEWFSMAFVQSSRAQLPVEKSTSLQLGDLFLCQTVKIPVKPEESNYLNSLVEMIFFTYG